MSMPFLARLILIAASLVAFAVIDRSVRAAPPPPDPVAEIPFVVSNAGWLIAPVIVNGQGPYRFIVDTAATVTAAYEPLADEQTFEPALLPDKRVLGLTETRYLPPHTLGDIEAGGIVMRDHVGVILPESPFDAQRIDGVLGLDFLERYVIRFDVDRRVMSLYDPGVALDSITDADAVFMERDDFTGRGSALYRTEVEFVRREVDCIIDTGSGRTVINSRALRSLIAGIRLNASRGVGTQGASRISDVFGKIDSAPAARIAQISIGGARWRRKPVMIYDADIFRELGVDRKPFCLLGADILMEQSFVLDFAGQRLIIER